MRIQSLYSKLAAATGESRLFQALRALSRVGDPQSVLCGDPALTPDEITSDCHHSSFF